MASADVAHRLVTQEPKSELRGQCFGTVIEGVLQYLVCSYLNPNIGSVGLPSISILSNYSFGQWLWNLQYHLQFLNLRRSWQSVCLLQQPLANTDEQDPSQIASRGRNARVIRLMSFLNGSPSLGHGSLTSYMLSSEFLKSHGHGTKARTQTEKTELITPMELELGMRLSRDDNSNPAIEVHYCSVIC